MNAIEQINRTIAGLSSDQLQHAELDLRAKVDNVGPVAITGTINPFRANETNEVRITVSDVDLTAASSYAGKFAGYRIAKGKLSLTLAYHVHGRNVSQSELQALADERAKAVREYLLQTGKVEAERLFLTESQSAGVKGEGSRVYLQLR